MIIETKYNIDDEVYRLFNGDIIKFKIKRIHIDFSTTYPNIKIRYNENTEEETYRTKQEAGEAWMLQNGLKIELKEI